MINGDEIYPWYILFKYNGSIEPSKRYFVFFPKKTIMDREEFINIISTWTIQDMLYKFLKIRYADLNYFRFRLL